MSTNWKTSGIIIFPEDENIKLHTGPTQSGGASKLWFCNLFNLTPVEMNKLVENENFNDVAPIFLPHLQGERAPLWDPNLKGIFYGINSKTNKGNLSRSIYEGVSFSAKLIPLIPFDDLPLKTLNFFASNLIHLPNLVLRIIS